MKTTKLILSTLLILGLSSCSIFNKTQTIITKCSPYALDAAKYTDSAAVYFKRYQQNKDAEYLIRSIMYGDSSAIALSNFISCSKDTTQTNTANTALKSTNQVSDIKRSMYTTKFGGTVSKPQSLKK